MSSIKLSGTVPVFESKAFQVHTDLSKMSEKNLSLELRYLVAHVREIGQNISLSVIRCINGETMELPFWALTQDQAGTLERIQAIVDEMKNRRLP